MSRSDQISPQDQSYDQAHLQTIKQQICLNNHQLLELTYNDQKFYQKLKQLNHLGTQSILQTKYHQALIYLNQAEKVLEYAASCGKTIQRTLIITTLNNQAALYQRAWQLEKAASYIQAIIYNISSFFQKQQEFYFSQKILDTNSIEYQDFRIYLWRKKLLALYYLQFCAVNSQNKKHSNAYNSASKAINLLKQICIDCYRYQKFQNQKNNLNQSNNQSNKSILMQLAKLKPLNKNKISFQSLLSKTQNYIAVYLKRIENKPSTQQLIEIKEKFETYSIGHLMQINPIQLQHHQDKINLKNQISQIQKTFKSVYVSIGHFILATELRFISTQKYTLDQNQRKNSTQYKQSQNYHLYAIILAAKFLPCQSVYFDHIVNSFRNHYKIDLLQNAKEYLNSNINLEFKSIFDQDLFQNQNQHIININLNMNDSKKQIKQQVSKFISEVIQNVNNKQMENYGEYNHQLKTQFSQEIKQDQLIMKQIENHNQIPINQTKSTKKGKKSGINHKKTLTLTNSKKNLHKSQSKYQSQNSHNNQYNQRLNTQIQNTFKSTSKEKNAKQIGIRQKEKDSKIKNIQISNKNDKSRSKSKKKKSEHFQFNKKAQILNINININRQKSTQNKYLIGMKENTEVKKNPDYMMAIPKIKRSKSKRISTHSQYEIQKNNEKPLKKLKKKQSFGQFKKNKKIEEQYGIINLKNGAGTTASFRPNNSHYGKSKSKKKSSQKFKFTSAEFKLKKLKSPRNQKNNINPY